MTDYERINHVIESMMQPSLFEYLFLFNKFPKCNYCEVGVWRGKNISFLLEEAKSDIQVTAVDPFDAYDSVTGGWSLSKEDMELNLKVFKKRLERFGDKINLIRKSSMDALSDLTDKSFDVIFVDGNHEVEPELQDLKGYWEKLKDNGIMLIHDMDASTVRVALDRFMAHLDVEKQIHSDVFLVGRTAAIIKSGDKAYIQSFFMDVHIFIATPAYNSNVTVNYTLALASFEHLKYRHSNFFVKNCSSITRARDICITEFYKKPECSHLFFLDSDVYVDGKDVEKMITSGKDVICAPTRLKTTDRISFAYDKPVRREGDYIVAKRVATACLMVSRKAVNDVIEYVKKNSPNGGMVKVDNAQNEVFDVFRTGGDKDNVYVDEDYWFCDILTELGYEIYVDTTIFTSHTGNIEFKSNESLIALSSEEILEYNAWRDEKNRKIKEASDGLEKQNTDKSSS